MVDLGVRMDKRRGEMRYDRNGKLLILITMIRILIFPNLLLKL